MRETRYTRAETPLLFCGGIVLCWRGKHLLAQIRNQVLKSGPESHMLPRGGERQFRPLLIRADLIYTSYPNPAKDTPNLICTSNRPRPVRYEVVRMRFSELSGPSVRCYDDLSSPLLVSPELIHSRTIESTYHASGKSFNINIV